MALNRLKANICGTNYTLVSEESLSYMRDLVAEVDTEMEQIITSDSRMSTTMAAVLTAVTCADKARKEAAAAEDLRVQLKRFVDEHEALEARLAEVRAELERLTEETKQTRAKAAKPRAPKAASKTKMMESFEEILDDAEET